MRDFHFPGRSPVLAANGMAATSHPLAASVAVETLKSGGNAMDAALAGALLLGICEPQMTGVGGDLFALFTTPGDTRIHALNGSGRAPAALDADRLRQSGHSQMPVSGALPVTVPGAVDAICRLSEDWGRIGLDRILAPAILYADEGVPVAPRVAFDWAGAAGNLDGAARKVYLDGDKAPQAGEMFRLPAMAEVFRKIARNGRAGFYEGDVAEDMVAALRAAGGLHTLDDFAATRSDVTEPVRGQYGGYEVVEHPPNGQGAAAILLLNILAQFDLEEMDPLGAERIHIEAEATKLAYDARNRFLADPASMDRTDYLLDPDTGRRLAALIDPARTRPQLTELAGEMHKDTIYITVVDRDRMAVSLIYSIFRSFGSGLASDKYGILFHNRGSGFTLEPGHPNEAGGGKRPMHTIIPGFLCRDGAPVMPFGVMGGAYQATGHARFVSDIATYGLDAQSSYERPRAFATDGILRLERGYGEGVAAALSEKGHQVEIPREPIGGAQSIRIHDTGVLEGASDPRKDGCALGY